jgi:hypothetical protein
VFQLTTLTTAKLNSVNVRSEKHGDDLVPALDLSFTIEAANAILDDFDPALRAALFYKAEIGSATAEQDELDGVEPVSDLPNLRFTDLVQPIKWDKAYAGYTVTVGHGLGGKSDIVLDGCAINNFALTLHEGGTCEVKFRVQCTAGLSEKVMGKLSLLVQHELQILLVAPEAMGESEPMENPLPGQPEPDKPLTAEDVFINGGEPAAVH